MHHCRGKQDRVPEFCLLRTDSGSSSTHAQCLPSLQIHPPRGHSLALHAWPKFSSSQLKGPLASNSYYAPFFFPLPARVCSRCELAGVNEARWQCRCCPSCLLRWISHLDWNAPVSPGWPESPGSLIAGITSTDLLPHPPFFLNVSSGVCPCTYLLSPCYNLKAPG